MPRQLFRKEAVERMSSPEQLDQLLPVTSPRGWLALAGLAVVLLVAVLWSVFGRIETTVAASGVLVRIGGIDLIEAPSDGTVAEVLVKVGEPVEAGQELVRLAVPLRAASVSDPTKTRIVKIRSERAGRVLAVGVLPGDTVRKAGLLLSLESRERPLQAVLYVSTKDGYKVRPGLKVSIRPSTSDRYTSREYVGTVTSAGRFPVSRLAVFRALQNEVWTEAILRQGPLLEVIVDFPHPDDVAAFFSGTPCIGQITVARQRPIEFVFPGLGGR